MLGELSKYFPQNITTVVDIFGGGFNFGANYEADTVIYNDINFIVKDLIEMIAEKNTYDLIRYIHKIIKRFDLSAEIKNRMLLRGHTIIICPMAIKILRCSILL